uniref:Methionyl-tRNA synthetase family protein n=1 Tax=Rhizophora mucronata TaxID=61149 RepID=A0A2P2M8V6_RHIMU
MLIAIFSPCFSLTFSMTSIYCSTCLSTSSVNFFVKGCESAPGASGTKEPYPTPVDSNCYFRCIYGHSEENLCFPLSTRRPKNIKTNPILHMII